MDQSKTDVNELALACASSAQAAEWKELLRRCVPVAAMGASRVCRMWMGTSSPAIVDDIVQEVFLKLCDQERKILREFRPRGEDSFFGLLRMVAASVANDYFRRQHSAKRGGKVVTIAIEDEHPSSAPPTVSDSSASMQQQVLYEELDRKLRSAPDVIAERDRTIFWLYYRQGLTAEEIAGLPAAGLSAKGVESALRRVTAWLRKELDPPRSDEGRQPAAQG